MSETKYFRPGDTVRRVSDFAYSLGCYFTGTPFQVKEARVDAVIDPNGGCHSTVYLELVTPSIPSPIVTETVTRIVPDQYGIVSVKENHPRYENSVNVCIQPTHATSEQLRNAAVTLTALADHLDNIENPTKENTNGR